MRLRSALLALALAASAQAQTARPLAVGGTQTGALTSEAPDRYTLDLDAGTFVAGHVDQRTVDVAVTVAGPDGELGAFDGPARGPEPFQFQAETAGTYTVTVAPFEAERGEYAITLRRAEPVATDPAGRVDQMMSRFDVEGQPGALVAVVDGGETVFERAYGTANLTHGVPMTVATRTNIGSTSKQFTAMALGLLAQRGELSLDDDVREHVPELPDFGATVTLRHLLTHTSGYREFLNTLALTGRRVDLGDHIDRAEVVQVVQRQTGLQDAPGTVWNYNNSGYSLAATVVERVTGQPFPEWMAKNVFGPLGMTDTVVRAEPTAIVPNSAQGYSLRDDGRWHEVPDLSAAMGAGGMYTTLGDLARWTRNFETMELGGAEVIGEMTTPYTLADGTETGYGLGLFIDEQGGLRRFHHGGADNAHRSMVMVFPVVGGAVIVEFNSPENATAAATRIAQAFFGDRMAQPDAADEPEGTDAARAAVNFDDALFDDYAGRYALDVAPAFVLAFRRDGDGGYLTQATGQQELEIVPTSDSTFVLTAVEAGVTFHRDPDGVVRSATLHQNGDNRATKLDVEPAAPADPADFAGRYHSPELETAYRLAVEDGELVAYLPRLVAPVPARATAPDTFVVEPTENFAITLAFGRDASGAVTGFTLDGGGRTRGVTFERAD